MVAIASSCLKTLGVGLQGHIMQFSGSNGRKDCQNLLAEHCQIGGRACCGGTTPTVVLARPSVLLGGSSKANLLALPRCGLGLTVPTAKCKTKAAWTWGSGGWVLGYVLPVSNTVGLSVCAKQQK